MASSTTKSAWLAIIAFTIAAMLALGAAHAIGFPWGTLDVTAAAIGGFVLLIALFLIGRNSPQT